MTKPSVRTIQIFAIAFAAWSGLALFTALIRYFQENTDLDTSLREMFLANYLLGLLGIPVWYWCNRVLAGRGLWIATIGHIFGAVGYALIWYLLYHALYPFVLGWQAYLAEPFAYYYLHLLDDGIRNYILISVICAAWSYHQKRQEAKQRAATLRAEHRQMELSILKAQLNPHFLFNCLNSVNALIGRDPERARSVLADLGETLRYSLDSDRALSVPLREELRFTKTYLAIELERFGDRIDVDWRIEPGSERCRVPPMILQPLVENAIKHGLAPSISGGRVEIGARTCPEGLRLWVEDNGSGSEKSNATLLREGRGLHHTHARLLAQYPEGKGLEIDCGRGFFRTRVTIPTSYETVPIPASEILSHA